MAARRQREAAAPRPRLAAAAAANTGPRNHTAAATRSVPRNQTVAATRSVPRNQTVAGTCSGPRHQPTAATTSRPHARNQRALGDISNHVNAPGVDGEVNRRRLTTQPTQPDFLSEWMARDRSLNQELRSLVGQLIEMCKKVAGDNRRLGNEKAQKEAQVQTVMEENVWLRAMLDKKEAMLDKKEAQLHAMTEQCKFMALNHHN